MRSLLPVCLGPLWAYGAYRVLTYRVHSVWVVEKHMGGDRRSLLPQYRLVDAQQRLYRVPYSLLSGQWDPRGVWAPVQVGRRYTLGYWGWDAPLLGLYRCVDRVTPDGDALQSPLPENIAVEKNHASVCCTGR